MSSPAAGGLGGVPAQQSVGVDPIDTGLRISPRVYWFKLLHPILQRGGRFFLQGRQHRRYFVMPGDYVSGYTAKFGAFEAEEIAVARHICRQGMGAQRLARSTLVDLGCHIGNYSVEMGPDFGSVLAVDAVQSYAHVARANLAWNGLEEKSTVVCAAISDHEGQLRLQMERYGNLGHARVSQDSTDLTTVVPAISLDALVHRMDIADVAFVKFDIEGHELEALQGALQTIRTHAPVIQVEVDKGHLPVVLERLRQTGVAYETWQVVRGNPARRSLLARLWTALRHGGNPVYLQRLTDPQANTRHLPCVLLVPEQLAIDWGSLFPISVLPSPYAPPASVPAPATPAAAPPADRVELSG